MRTDRDVELFLPHAPPDPAAIRETTQSARTLRGAPGQWVARPGGLLGWITMQARSPNGHRVTVHAQTGIAAGWCADRAFRAFSESYTTGEVTSEAEQILVLAAGEPGSLDAAAFAEAVGAGWTVEQATTALEAGLPVRDAYRWLTLISDRLPEASLLSPEAVVQWHRAASATPQSLAMREVADWVLAGVTRPDERPAGLRGADALALTCAQAPLDAGWAGAGHWLCPRLVRFAVAAGRSPRESSSLLGALYRRAAPDGGRASCSHRLGARQFVCGFTPGQRESARAVPVSMADVDWAAAAVCLNAGFSIEETLAHLHAGRDMKAVQVMAGLIA